MSLNKRSNLGAKLRQEMQYLELNNIERQLLLRQGILRRIRSGSRSHRLRCTLRTAALPGTVLLLNPARLSIDEALGARIKPDHEWRVGRVRWIRAVSERYWLVKHCIFKVWRRCAQESGA